MVQDALVSVQIELGAQQRQAEGLRFGAEQLEGADLAVSLSASLDTCDETLTGLRDAALLSVGYDAGLRVSEPTAIEVKHISLKTDGTVPLHIPKSRTDQTKKGVDVWISMESMRHLGAWLEAAKIAEGVVLRRVHVARKMAKEAQKPRSGNSTRGYDRNDRERADGRTAQPVITVYMVGKSPLTTQGVNTIYRRVVEQAWADRAIELPKDDIVGCLKRISSHSLRVGLTQDLIARGQDGVAIAKALRWKSTAQVIHYGNELSEEDGATRVMSNELRK